SNGGDTTKEIILGAAICKLESIVAIKREFRRQFNQQPPRHEQIYEWLRKFVEDGSIYKRKNPGRPYTSDKNFERIRTLYERSPRKSTSRASKELNIPHPTHCISSFKTSSAPEAIQTAGYVKDRVFPLLCLTLFTVYDIALLKL
ncbi:hypothetical protein C0J52_23480, partial [Blattella germanica]